MGKVMATSTSVSPHSWLLVDSCDCYLSSATSMLHYFGRVQNRLVIVQMCGYSAERVGYNVENVGHNTDKVVTVQIRWS